MLAANELQLSLSLYLGCFSSVCFRQWWYNLETSAGWILSQNHCVDIFSYLHKYSRQAVWGSFARWVLFPSLLLLSYRSLINLHAKLCLGYCTVSLSWPELRNTVRYNTLHTLSSYLWFLFCEFSYFLFLCEACWVLYALCRPHRERGCVLWESLTLGPGIHYVIQAGLNS